VPRLAALEIDPQAAAQVYRDRIVGPVRGVLPDAVVKGIEEQLSGACTTEIAAFDEFTSLLTDALQAAYDHIVFDTAPTGHTIRLLQLPGAWSGFLEDGKGDASCLGPLAGLQKQRCSTGCGGCAERRIAPGWCWWRVPSPLPCAKRREPMTSCVHRPGAPIPGGEWRAAAP
jgi:anion-transporting  ArsA/GET3 family ATPase